MTEKPPQPMHWQQRALVRALERRYGQTASPCVFQQDGLSVAEGSHWRVTDAETGSYVVGVFRLGRLSVRKEKDGSAL